MKLLLKVKNNKVVFGSVAGFPKACNIALLGKFLAGQEAVLKTRQRGDFVEEFGKTWSIG